MWTLVHECTHNLVFRGRSGNRWMAIVANLPMVLPTAVAFSVHHVKHHKYPGIVQHDADLPLPWELWLFHHGPLGRLTWQILYPIVQSVRTLFMHKKHHQKCMTACTRTTREPGSGCDFCWTADCRCSGSCGTKRTRRNIALAVRISGEAAWSE